MQLRTKFQNCVTTRWRTSKEKEMKIMLVTCADSIHAVRWANAYAERGHEVYFVAMRGHEVRGDKLEPGRINPSGTGKC